VSNSSGHPAKIGDVDRKLTKEASK
jgi:hypothetical protein